MNTAHQQDRAWADEAVRRINAENNRSADTHLYSVPLPDHWGVQLYLKDESTHRTGSLKHRLARSLFLFGLVNGWIREGTTIVEASSGSTAVSEAYFAQLLGLPFIAVMTRTTSREKIALIEQFGGSCHLVDHASEVYEAAADLASSTGGHYMDQFTYAERATDWRGNNNIAESIFGQLALEEHPIPRWVVVGAGTGGTSATIGRYLRYHRHETRLAVVDPENSAFYPGWRDSRSDAGTPPLRGTAAGGFAVTHRGHRPAADGAEFCARRDRPHDPGSRRRVGGGHAAPAGTRRTARRPVHRHQPLGRVAAHRRDDRGGPRAVLSRSCATPETATPGTTTTRSGWRPKAWIRNPTRPCCASSSRPVSGRPNRQPARAGAPPRLDLH